jgi:hypothetical protein
MEGSAFETKTRTMLTQAQIHFTYAGDAGNEQGEAIAKETLELFDEHWDDF